MSDQTNNDALNSINPLAYMGVNPRTPPNFLIRSFPPNPFDSKNVQIGALWLNTGNSNPPSTPPTINDLYVLVALYGGLATWLPFSAGDLQFLTGNTGGPVPPTAHNINVVGDNIGVTIAGNPGTSTLTVSLIGGGVAAQIFPTDIGTATPIAGVLNIITGSLVTNNCGSSVIFMAPGASNTVQLFVTDPIANTCVGFDSGNILATGDHNTSLGISSLSSLTTGASNVTIGSVCGQNLTIGDHNAFVGAGAGLSATTQVTSVFLGSTAASQITDGFDDIIIGYTAGAAYTSTENNNIIVGVNTGVVGENDTIRIGSDGISAANQTRCFVNGIYGITPALPGPLPVIIDSAGQLGTGPGISIPQCAFGAFLSATVNNVTGDGTFYTVIFDSVIFDIGGDYNPITGTFTAPTDGSYQFNYVISCQHITDQNSADTILLTPTFAYQPNLVSPVAVKRSDDIYSFSFSTLIELTAAQTVNVEIAIGGGSNFKTINLGGSPAPANPIITYFSGFRIDPATSFITGTETFHTDDGNNVIPDLAGLVNVTGDNGINTTGTVGPNTITIHYTPTSNFQAVFNPETNITGDNTVAQLGATVAATVSVNVGGDFFPGNGIGGGASYTAPATGLYFLYFYCSYQVGGGAGDSVDFSLGLSGAIGINLGIFPTHHVCAGFENNSGFINTGGSCSVNLNLGDVVFFTIQSGGASKTLSTGIGTVGGYRIA